MDLDFVRIECEIVADCPARLAAPLYNALRDFEGHFRALCCRSAEGQCISCNGRSGCPCLTVFDQSVSPDPEVMRRHQKPPLPFALYVEGGDDNTASCSVGIVIIGSAVNHAGLFHSALSRMIEASVSSVLPEDKYSLKFYCLDYQSVRHGIRDAAPLTTNIILLSGRHLLQDTVHSDSVRIILKSPLRLVRNGLIEHHFDFGLFFRSQLRRCSSLYAYYGSGELELDFVSLSEAAQNVAVSRDNICYTQPLWSRLPSRGGLVGSAACSGLSEPMLSLLRLGSFFNAGKGAAFGLGRYQLEV